MKILYAFCLCYLITVTNSFSIFRENAVSGPSFSTEAIPVLAGAATVAELSNAVLLALQANDPEQLAAYLPTDAQLNALKKQGSEDMKAVLENRSATDLKNSFRTDFETLVQEGVSHTLNWSEAILAETKLGQTTAKNRHLHPVEMVLQTKQNQSVGVLFETVKIKNRYFLFRGIQLKS
jgi:hypothetical protein